MSVTLTVPILFCAGVDISHWVAMGQPGGNALSSRFPPDLYNQLPVRLWTYRLLRGKPAVTQGADPSTLPSCAFLIVKNENSFIKNNSSLAASLPLTGVHNIILKYHFL